MKWCHGHPCHYCAIGYLVFSQRAPAIPPKNEHIYPPIVVIIGLNHVKPSSNVGQACVLENSFKFFISLVHKELNATFHIPTGGHKVNVPILIKVLCNYPARQANRGNFFSIALSMTILFCGTSNKGFLITRSFGISSG